MNIIGYNLSCIKRVLIGVVINSYSKEVKMRRIYKSIILFVYLLSIVIGTPKLDAKAQGVTSNPAINKQFSPTTINPGEISRLSVTIYNPNNVQLDNATWSDNLILVQPGISIAGIPNMTNDCGGTVSAVANSTTLSLTGGTVPAKPFGGE